MKEKNKEMDYKSAAKICKNFALTEHLLLEHNLCPPEVKLKLS